MKKASREVGFFVCYGYDEGGEGYGIIFDYYGDILGITIWG